MSFASVLGMCLALVALTVLSIYSGKAAKKEKKAGATIVTGAIMGTLVGGSSTVGTAQLAYTYGLSAWWFTLGSGIACLVLAIFYIKPLRNSGEKTLIAIVRKKYGDKAGILASVLTSVGSFINIIPQLIAGTAIIAVLFPKVPVIPSLILGAVFMMIYVVFGGTKGSGIVGLLKIVLLYAVMMVCGILVLSFSGGLTGFFEVVKNIPNPENIAFHSFFARGIGTDLGACFSLILGVITTQIYAQAVFAACETKEAMKGVLISSVLTPPVGFGGVLVGLYMRSAYPGIVPKTALTLFITEHLPPFFSGLALGALFITVVGGGAGLSLGIATVLRKEIIERLPKKPALSGNALEKCLIILLLITATILSMGPLGDTILNFAFMSMGLRGATLFVPLCFALWCKTEIPSAFVLVALVAGPIFVLIFGLWKILPFDPLFAGVLVSGLIMAAGYLHGKKIFKNLLTKEM